MSDLLLKQKAATLHDSFTYTANESHTYLKLSEFNRVNIALCILRIALNITILRKIIHFV